MTKTKTKTKYVIQENTRTVYDPCEGSSEISQGFHVFRERDSKYVTTCFSLPAARHLVAFLGGVS